MGGERGEIKNRHKQENKDLTFCQLVTNTHINKSNQTNIFLIGFTS